MANASGYELAELSTWLQDAGLPAPTSVRAREGARRALNVAVAALGLLLAAPLMLVIAVAIKLTSRGPLFYTQTRIGIDVRNPVTAGGNGRRKTDAGGRPFRIFKFRTMAPSRGEAQVWARPDDPRVTAVGRILRKYRLDELPQLVNVLRGDMNIVGPRPEQPRIFTELREQIPNYQTRQRVRPGITGWAQVNQGYDDSLDNVRQKVAYDLEYLRRHSVVEDLRILARTVPVVVFRRGAW
ncbi:MAG TPA: sugar transferase [Gemmatimonadales bacterium]|nr:sugar transferase [Gemmatimonadales bacterium]